ncbi:MULTISPECIES: flagellar hook-basal body protein [Paenibacillus]|uniref:flagellar hook-basal body protein n=1 Tax=Paenibacillus TaxID=44249 RepID=UPI00129D9851|nr:MULTISPECIES: flagellar hook-basal body protein [Paenibacillus]MBE7681662.1 flagellar hook-basal body complex protein [Paenibacillus sp. P13VS]MBY0217292.1 flagellar hook-basal body protein [Paenibacillus illinoisensis]MCM3207925.1 flagellar hook-basal body protein [Paenibacillus illinoisensis]
MNNSMISAKVSMTAIQQRLDVISDNIANVNTAGYKSKQAAFEDVLTRVQQQPDKYKLDGRSTPMGYNLGFGARLTSVTKDMSQGTLNETGNPTDLAIEGNAMFAVEANGQKMWTRQGAFHFVPDPTPNPNPNAPQMMVLVNGEGYFALDRQGNRITAPNNSKVAFDEKGNLLIRRGNEANATIGAQLQLVDIERPEGLVQYADNLFGLDAGLTEDDVFGANAATRDSVATIRAGFLEQSNVDLTQEMALLMQGQRTYQLAARALTSSDSMAGLANTIRA